MIFFIDNYYIGEINALQLNREYKGWLKDSSISVFKEREFNYFVMNSTMTILIFKNDVLKEETHPKVIELINKRCKVMKIFYIVFFVYLLSGGFYKILDSYTTLFAFVK